MKTEPGSKASPIPWTARKGGRFSIEKGALILGPNGNRKYPPSVVRVYLDGKGRRCTAFICECNVAGLPNEANAQFIARAVNSFDALLEAARNAQEILSRNVIVCPELDAAIRAASAPAEKKKGE